MMYILVSLTLLAATVLATPILPQPAAVTGNGLSFYGSNINQGSSLKPGAQYTCYRGTAENFPSMSQWAKFDDLWDFQIKNALIPVGDTSPQVRALQSAIVSIGQTAKVDPRVILGVIIQESTGNLKVGCTNNGVRNCGIMQSHNPVDEVFDPSNMVQSIIQMIQDGVEGTSAGPGLVQLFNNQGGVTTDGNLWKVLRAYNSGAVNANDLSNGMGATASYVSDIANYLQGWQGWGSPARDSCHFS